MSEINESINEKKLVFETYSVNDKCLSLDNLKLWMANA